MMFLQYFVQGAYLPIVAGYLTDTLGFSESNKGWFMAAIGAGPILAPYNQLPNYASLFRDKCRYHVQFPLSNLLKQHDWHLRGR